MTSIPVGAGYISSDILVQNIDHLIEVLHFFQTEISRTRIELESANFLEEQVQKHSYIEVCQQTVSNTVSSYFNNLANGQLQSPQPN